MYKSELLALIPADRQEDAEACIKELMEGARKMGAEDNNWSAFARGCLRSWTQWFSTALITWPVSEQLVRPYINELLPPAGASKWIAVIGLISFALRAKTTQSLEQKGVK